MAHVSCCALHSHLGGKQDIALAVKGQLEAVMQEYGYQILQALVTDMDPDPRVKEAMNEINASKRMREAATNKAEADKIMQVSSFDGHRSFLATFGFEHPPYRCRRRASFLAIVSL